MKKQVLSIVAFLFLATPFVQAQQEDLQKEIEALREQVSNLKHSFNQLQKGIDDILWHERVGDVAHIDKVYLTGPPKADRTEKNKTRQGYGNPFRFQSYIFMPKDIEAGKKYPLIVFPHGGVHSNFNTYYTHIIRELMAQQYIVVAAEYRGSTGYGRGFHNAIDYGGLEVEDVFATREYMVENYSIIDADRIGIMGWSHGGLISLFRVC